MLRHVLHEMMRLLLVTVVTLVAIVGYGLHVFTGTAHGPWRSCGVTCCPSDSGTPRLVALNQLAEVTISASADGSGKLAVRCALCELLNSYRSSSLSRPAATEGEARTESISIACPADSGPATWRMPPVRGPPAV